MTDQKFDLKYIGIILVIAGVLGAALSVGADYIGVNVTQGDQDYKEFGWVQGVGLAAGVIMIIAGAVVFMKFSKKPEEEETKEDGSEGSDEEFVCPTCGASVVSDAGECSECGEKFEEEEFECPTCSAKIASDAKKCSECGEVFEEEAPAKKAPKEEVAPKESAAPAAEPAADEYECPTCGAKVQSSATKCPECGEVFEEGGVEEYECPTCGGKVASGDTKCPECGEEFE